MKKTWKANWEESKQHYLDWWDGKGLVISMWEHLEIEGVAHEPAPKPPDAKDADQFFFDPEWRADYIHYALSRSSLKADIPPVANTHLGPGSLSAILGGELEASGDTIWIRESKNPVDHIHFDEQNKWWKVHTDLLKACRKRSEGKYFVGCPDLIEGLDTLIGINGTEPVLMDLVLRPEIVESQLQKINDIYFRVFDRIYDIIQVDGEMAFCYFSLWGPGKVAKLQSDISLMISENDYGRFVLPFIQEQCNKLDYTLYHLDGVDALRHLDVILEIDELNAVQWTPGEGQPQGGNPCWYDLYRKILSKGKSVMPCWVEPDELQPLLDYVGASGIHVLMHFKTEKDIDRAVEIAEQYR
jgi:hypothetical protein